MYLDKEQVESLLWQIGGRNNWNAIYEVPSWMVIYDLMPRRMQLAFNLKLQGFTPKEIALEMEITLQVAYEHLRKAKKRIVNSLLNYA